VAQRPRRVCPVCGADVLLSCLTSHVGSSRCVTRLHQHLAGVPHHPEHGPRVLAAALELHRALHRALESSRRVAHVGE
jgi:hypothetical protein